MKKEKLTLQEHEEMGAALKTFRNKHLIQYAVWIQNATPKNSPQSEAVRKALNAIDELRNVMDALAYKDYFDEIGDAFMGIYYGTEDKEERRGEMTTGDSKELYHYTTGRCFRGIVADGVIKPATAFEDDAPVVWFTFSRDLALTADEKYQNDHGGLVRFVVDPNCAPYTWPEFTRRSGIEKNEAQIFSEIALDNGVWVEDWRVSFLPVPRTYWLRVDVWKSGEWTPVEVER